MGQREGKKETDRKPSMKAKNLQSEECLFYLVLITGEKIADRNSQLAKASASSPDPSEKCLSPAGQAPSWMQTPAEHKAYQESLVEDLLQQKVP